jgi:hypothetical protein
MLSQSQIESLTPEQQLEYKALVENNDTDALAQYEYFYGFTIGDADIKPPTNEEIELYKSMTDQIKLKHIAKMLGFVPHTGQQPVFFTIDERADTINNLVMVLGRRAQTLDSIIKSPTGDITFKDVKVGDVIFDPDGGLQTVDFVHDITEGDVYEVTVGDRVVKVDGEHLFTVVDHHGKERVLETKYLKEYYVRDRKNSHYTYDKTLSPTSLEYKFRIKNTTPVTYPEAVLPINPYLLGLILGDGTIVKNASLGMRDIDAIVRGCELQGIHDINIRMCKPGYYLTSLGRHLNTPLRELGLLGTNSKTKFVPAQYLTASIQQRLELLRGLLDTDGYIGIKPRNNYSYIEYSTISPHLKDAVSELVKSLGGNITVTTKIGKYKKDGHTIECNLVYRCFINLTVNPFWVSRKACKFTPPPVLYNFIRDIQYVGKAPVRCITVSGNSSCYVTDNYVRTHNCGKSASTSVVACRELAVPFSSTILLTPTFNNAKIIFNEVLKNIQKLKLPIKSINRGAFRFELENGARFSANSASNIESALGSYNSLIIVDESQSVPNLMEIMNQMLVPTLLDYGVRPSGILYGRQVYLGTPRGQENQLYDLFCKQEEFANWKSFNSPSSCNPILPSSYFEQMRLELGEMLYRQEILAEFFGSDENVFWAFNKDICTYIDGDIQFNHAMAVVSGIDIGLRDSTAQLWAYRDARGTYYIDKAYQKNMTSTAQHISNYRDVEASMLSEPEMRYGDPAAAQTLFDYNRDYEYLVHPANNSFMDSINYVNQMFSPTGADERPRLMINAELAELIRQVQRVRWKDKASKSSKDPFYPDPKGTHWDLIAALRYMMYTDSFNLASSFIIESRR